jgi:hypothetical protein
MSGGIERMHDEERGEAFEIFKKKLQGMSFHDLDRLVGLAWSVVHTFNSTSYSPAYFAKSVEQLERQLQKVTR